MVWGVGDELEMDGDGVDKSEGDPEEATEESDEFVEGFDAEDGDGREDDDEDKTCGVGLASVEAEGPPGPDLEGRVVTDALDGLVLEGRRRR